MENIKKINNNTEKHFTASALIMKEGEVLLINHKKLGVWLYPGGHVENNETPDETVIREVKEETGLDVEIISEKDDNLADTETKVFALHQPYTILCEEIKGDLEHYHIDMVYRCKIITENSNEIINSYKKTGEIDFFGLDDLSRINLFPNFKRLIERVLKEKRYKNF